MFAFFNAEQRHVGNARFLGKLSIRQLAPGFAQVDGQLTVEALSHRLKVSEQP